MESLTKSQLAKYRIEKAWSFYQDAMVLLEQNSQASAINRFYYAFLNMVLALF